MAAAAFAQPGTLPVQQDLAVWLEADSGVVVSPLGDVDVWEDQSTGANHAAQTVSFRRPTLVGDATNGLPMVRFDGINDSLLIGATPALDTDVLTWFVVARVNTIPPGIQPGINDAGFLLSSRYLAGAGSLSNRIWGTFVNLAGTLASHARSDTGAFVGSQRGVQAGEFIVISAVWGGDDQVRQFVNGTPDPAGAAATAAPSGHQSTMIGVGLNDLGDLVRNFDGDIAAVLIYSAELSDPDRQAVEAFLTDKWVPMDPPLPSNVEVTAPDAGSIVQGAAVPTTANADGADEVEFFVDGVSVGVDGAAPFAVTFDSSQFDDGPTSISVEARNEAGASSSDPVVVEIDNTSAEAGITMPSDGDVVGGVVDFVATATDANGIAGVNFVAGAALDVLDVTDPFAVLYDTTLDSDGPVDLEIVVVDGAGNVSTDSISVTVDNTDPVLSILSPADEDVVSGTIVIEADVVDDNLDRVEFFAAGISAGIDTDGSDGFSISFDTLTVPDGGLGLDVEAVDLAGNSARASITVQVHNAIPVRLIRRPGDGRKVRKSICIRVDATGVAAQIETVRVFADDQLLLETSSLCFSVPFDTRDVVDGPLVLSAIAEDAAGVQYIDENTVVVKNLRLRLKPRRLKLSSAGTGDPVRLTLSGPSVGLLAPASAHTFALRLPGGGSVIATGGDDTAICDVLFVEFDRLDVIGLINQSYEDPPGKVVFEVVVDDRDIGKVKLRVRP